MAFIFRWRLAGVGNRGGIIRDFNIIFFSHFHRKIDQNCNFHMRTIYINIRELIHSSDTRDTNKSYL